MATIRHLASGRYSVEVSETELALTKTALDQTERVSRFGIEILDRADHATDGGRPAHARLRREIEALALRGAALRSLQETMQEAERGEEAA